jgi:D-alanyl-D-alanine carboxypeptidase/D-alanyl-D-alanine-endopeptidase (penicillin-binding protein 4)
MLKQAFVAFSLIAAAPVVGQTPLLADQVAAELAKAPPGTHFGVLVVDAQGDAVLAIDPDGRFVPASNTKLFTTTAAYAALPGIDQPDAAGGAGVALISGQAGGAPDAWLIGHGDARLSSAASCVIDCLASLADAIAAKTRAVRDVVGDDSAWPDQRWAAGISWNNLGTISGTAVSALNLDDNQLAVTVLPGLVGQTPTVSGSAYYRLRNDAVTTPAGSALTLGVERAAGGMELRLYGQIPADAQRWQKVLGIDDPAHYAAWTLARMLAARGIKVTGTVRARHRTAGLPADPVAAVQDGELALLARVVPAPLADDVTIINKHSQNLHAQALLRRLGGAAGDGSIEAGVAALTTVIDRAGLSRGSYGFADGAGMSGYNRASPRAVVALLRWAATQPWGGAWRASLPVGGVDGTLARRFVGTPLQGAVFAKTGTLNATHALSGYLRGASGQELTFSILVNDLPEDAHATQLIDAVLAVIAAHN